MKTFNAKCNICKNKARIWYEGKWWCSIEPHLGAFNMKGYCSEKTSNNNRHNKAKNKTG